jgi:hypothetical protein
MRFPQLLWDKCGPGAPGAVLRLIAVLGLLERGAGAGALGHDFAGVLI